MVGLKRCVLHAGAFSGAVDYAVIIYIFRRIVLED